MRIRSGFVKGLLLICALACLAVLVIPTGISKTKAKIIITRLEEKEVAFALSQFASEIGGVTNQNVNFAFQAVAYTSSISNKVRTNNNAEVIDFWDTPLRIATVPRTNFIIQSAGPNQKFGDKDDIIFNSASNVFVNP